MLYLRKERHNWTNTQNAHVLLTASSAYIQDLFVISKTIFGTGQNPSSDFILFPCATHKPSSFPSPPLSCPQTMSEPSPSQLFPLVKAFLTANGFTATAKVFDQELGKSVCDLHFLSFFYVNYNGVYHSIQFFTLNSFPLYLISTTLPPILFASLAYTNSSPRK